MRSLSKFLILIFYLFSIDLAALVSRVHYKEIKRIALEIIEKCPPSECFYVGLGRSPTAILAFYEAIGIADQMQLPLSSFRYLPPENSPYYLSFKEKFKMYPLPNHYKNKIDQHLRKWLPDKTKLGSKKIMLIDYAMSGESVLSAMSHIEDYYRGNGMTNEVRITMIADRYALRNIAPVMGAVAPGTHLLKLSPESDYQRVLLMHAKNMIVTQNMANSILKLMNLLGQRK